MAGKCGSVSGPVLRHLKLTCERDEHEGVQSLLRELDANGKPRVAGREDIQLLCQWLSSELPQVGQSFQDDNLELSFPGYF